MASISIKPITSDTRIKVKHLRINLFADTNNNTNNNIHININNNITINIHKEEEEENRESEKSEKIEKSELHINDSLDDGSNTEGIEKKSGYYYKHRDRKLEYQKKYNKEQGDKIKNYNKDYYQKRREEILEKAKTKIICECRCEVQLFNMNSHKKTKKHLRALDAIKLSKK